MIITSSHTINVSLNQFIDLYFDEKCNAFFDQRLKIRDRKIVDQREDEDAVSIEYHVFPVRDIPVFVSKILNDNVISYFEKRIFLKKENKLEFFNTPGIFPEKVKCHGVCMLHALDEQSLRRDVEIELNVNIPVVGAAVEGIIIKEVQSYLKRSAEWVSLYVNGQDGVSGEPAEQ